MTHIPKPWTRQNAFNSVHHTIETEDGEPIALIYHDDDAPEVALGIAQLIAAAPDLLEALEATTAQLERIGDDRPGKDKEFIDQGKAAIAKAKGQNSQ